MQSFLRGWPLALAVSFSSRQLRSLRTLRFPFPAALWLPLARALRPHTSAPLQYLPETFEQLAFEETCKKLVYDRGYPEARPLPSECVLIVFLTSEYFSSWRHQGECAGVRGASPRSLLSAEPAPGVRLRLRLRRPAVQACGENSHAKFAGKARVRPYVSNKLTRLFSRRSRILLASAVGILHTYPILTFACKNGLFAGHSEVQV